ncbi:MAG: hypothetical protein U9R53_09855 [Chloroflexota bacterium]|nr:hypothetical protein [Chloroflexota bacterium]
MDFGEILSKAWKTIWKHKILWVFGILAGCSAASSGGGVGSGGGTSAAPMNYQYGTGDIKSFLSPSAERGVEDFFQFLADIPVWVWIAIGLFLLVLGIVLSILFLMVGILGTTGVVKGTCMADGADPDAKPISFGDIFKAIKPYYWKVFLLNLGLRIAGFVLSLFVALPIVLFAVCTCFIGLFLLIPVGWFINLMVNFTTIAIIEEDKGIFEGISRAWQVIIRHLGNVLLMFLILGIGQLIASLVIGLPLIAVPIPILINLFVTGFRTVTVGLIVSSILFLAFLPLAILLGGVLRAYVLSSWTLTYRRLIAEGNLEPMVISTEDDEGETNI